MNAQARRGADVFYQIAGLILLLLTLGGCAGGNLLGRREKPEFDWLRVSGRQVVNQQNAPVTLRGANLGNWFVIEPSMLDWRKRGIKDQWEIEKTLESRFGEPEGRRLMEVYRQSFITERDFEIIKSFKMNLLRLPFEYRLLQDDAHPFAIKPDGWKWLDQALEWAEANGMRTIIDMHGAPGRQSKEQHTGRAAENQLWGNPQRQAQTLWLWEQIAERYKNRPSVLGYDLLNEPWGSDPAQLCRMELRIHQAIRKHDSRHIVIFDGWTNNVGFYPAPEQLGDPNVMYTMHFYPGFFGWGKPVRETNEKFLAEDMPRWRRMMAKMNAPLLVGEFDVVYRRAGGPEMMGRFYDAFARAGWPATMWSYKAIVDEGGIGAGRWAMVVNRDPKPLLDIKTSPKEEIEAWFRSLATQPYEIDEPLRGELLKLESNPPMSPLPR